MASISSLTSSSSSSIYGNRNVISGLASGLDTESMIENIVSGYKTKLTELQQERTKVEWKQEKYRSMISKMSSFLSNYATYSSTNNLLSRSFFTNAVNVTANGANSAMVSASGKTSSNVKLLGVQQLATAASYTVDISKIGNLSKTLSTDDNKVTATAAGALDLGGSVGALNGTLTLQVGEETVALKFDQNDKYASVAELQEGIKKKLEDITLADGTTKASDKIKVNSENGTIGFTGIADDAGNTEAVTIKSAGGNLGELLGLKDIDEQTAQFTVSDAGALTQSASDVLQSGRLSITLDGSTKTIDLSGLSTASNDEFIDGLNEKIADAFGEGKLTAGVSDDGKLQFAAGYAGSTFSVAGSDAKVNSVLGLGSSGVRSTINPDTLTLGSLLDDSVLNDLGITDDEGNTYYEFTLNGFTGKYTKDTTLTTILNDINSKSGVNAVYSQATGQIQFTSKETGEASKIDFGDDLASALFGTTDARGEDAILSMEVNGVKMENIQRSSNSVTVDGMTMNLKGTFSGEAVTFTASPNSSKIVSTIKQLVDDYNAMVTEIKTAYSTMPEKRSNGDYYEPLTETDKADLSESAIKTHEDKAKAGLLFGDRDLSNLYNQILGTLSGLRLGDAGISVNYADGLTTLKLDEEALTKALEENPDKVADVFAGSSSKTGLIERLQKPLERYGKTVDATKGILVEKAGSTLAPTTLYTNQMYNELGDLDEDISKVQNTINEQIDFYTSKFTYLEKLIAQMNNQSGMLMGLTGGY